MINFHVSLSRNVRKCLKLGDQWHILICWGTGSIRWNLSRDPRQSINFPPPSSKHNLNINTQISNKSLISPAMEVKKRREFQSFNWSVEFNWKSVLECYIGTLTVSINLGVTTIIVQLQLQNTQVNISSNFYWNSMDKMLSMTFRITCLLWTFIWFLILIQCDCFMAVGLIEWKCGPALFSSVQGKWVRGRKEKLVSAAAWCGLERRVRGFICYITLNWNWTHSLLLLYSNQFSFVLSNKSLDWQIARAKTKECKRRVQSSVLIWTSWKCCKSRIRSREGKLQYLGCNFII